MKTDYSELRNHLGLTIESNHSLMLTKRHDSLSCKIRPEIVDGRTKTSLETNHTKRILPLGFKVSP